MFTSSNLGPEQALDLLRAPLVSYRRALDSAVSFADTTMRELPSCPYTWSALVRYWTWQEIRQENQANNNDWRGRRLANNGLEITMQAHTFRPFKSINAGPPAPGHSSTKRDYYSQYRQAAFELPEVMSAEGANLIVDWTVRADRHPLLALSKPKGFWKYRGTPKLEWRVIVHFGGDDGGQTLRFAPSDEDDSGFDFTIDRSEVSYESDVAG